MYHVAVKRNECLLNLVLLKVTYHYPAHCSLCILLRSMGST